MYYCIGGWWVLILFGYVAFTQELCKYNYKKLHSLTLVLRLHMPLHMLEEVADYLIEIKHEKTYFHYGTCL